MAGVPTYGELSQPQTAAVEALAGGTTTLASVQDSTAGAGRAAVTTAGAAAVAALAAGQVNGTNAPSTGSTDYTLLTVTATVNQTGTASGSTTAVKVNMVETAALGPTYLCDYQIGGISKWSIRGTAPITSATDATWDGYKASALTQLFKGATRIQTAAGINKVAFYAPTLTSDTATLTIDQAATVYISGPPIAGTNVAITKPVSLLVASGNVGIGRVPTGPLSIKCSSTNQFVSIDCPDAAEWGLTFRDNADSQIFKMTGNGSNGQCILGTLAATYYTSLYSGGIDRIRMAKAALVSSGSRVYQGVYLPAETVTISGTTNIDTATGLNKFVVEAPTYSNASIAIAKAFTQRIDNAPQVTGGATIVARGALLVSAGSIVCQSAALATNATEGFLYIPSCAGTPSGTPQNHAGTIPIVYDTTNHKLYVYDGGWVGGTAPGAWS